MRVEMRMDVLGGPEKETTTRLVFFFRFRVLLK
jgi:hypothetical protein